MRKSRKEMGREQTKLAVLGKETEERVARVDVALGGVVVRRGDRAAVVRREGGTRRCLHADSALAAAAARWFAAPSRHRQSSVVCSPGGGCLCVCAGGAGKKDAVRRDKRVAGSPHSVLREKISKKNVLG